MRPYEPGDGVALAERLHPVSRAELSDWTLEHLPGVLNDYAAVGHATTGLVDGEVVFVGLTAALAVGSPNRVTGFLFARGHDHLMGFALRRWARAERREFPDVTFLTHSPGEHPRKERFLALSRFTPCERCDKVTAQA